MGGSMMKSILAFAALALVYVYAADCTSKEVEIPAMEIRKEMCPTHAPFYGFMGCASALVFACLGAAYGTAKSGVGVAAMGVMHHEMIMKSIIPKLFVGVILILIFAEALGLYGLIVALILSANQLTCDDIATNTYYSLSESCS